MTERANIRTDQNKKKRNSDENNSNNNNISNGMAYGIVLKQEKWTL